MDEEDCLTINKEYAQRYVKRKQAEELSKLRDKYGDVAVSQLEGESESSSSEEEDEEAEALTPQVEKDFLRTLSLIRSKDPSIYDSKVMFFSKELEIPGEKSKERPMYLKDYERKRLLERGSLAEVSDSEEGEGEEDKSRLLTYSDEQEKLKESFKGAVDEMEGEVEGEEGERGEVLTLRKKSEQEKSQEEDDYKVWLEGKEGSKLTAQEKKELDSLKQFWTDPHLDEGEVFLRDYILNKGYMDKDAVRVPTYDEVVGSEDEGHPDDSEDEEALEEQEDFERKFNFRFEEPGGELITSYPRTIASSVRRPDDKRKQKRKERQERKEQEKEAKKEELKRMKNLKKKEIMEKLDKLATITGNPVESLGLSLDDLEEDFDPTEYDAKMASLFNEEYYAAGEEEEAKPVFPEMEGEDELVDWDPWQPAGPSQEGAGDEPHCDDPDFNMDADYEPGINEELAESAKLKRKKKRRSKFAAVVQKPKPTFEPDEKSFEEYLQEYYELDSLVTGEKFKYRKVTPNDFGLTTDEILQCRDKELNRWVSLSKSVKYQTAEEERKDKRRYRKRARDWKRKKQILTSLYGGEADGHQQASSKDSTAAVRGVKSSEKKDTISEVEDDSGDVKTKSERIASSHGGGQSKMASCQDQDNMEDSDGLASGENSKKTPAGLDNIGGGSLRASEDREGTHRHNKSSKRKRKKTLLKLKLKKTVSKARLKSYGISV